MTSTLDALAASKKDKPERRLSSWRPRSWCAGLGAGPVADRPGRAAPGEPGTVPVFTAIRSPQEEPVRAVVRASPKRRAPSATAEPPV